tara:strand:- start:145 stop:1134 length:990 start_codon:yes stop_codon:yes gene_type:complete
MSINYGKLRTRINQGHALASALGIKAAKRTTTAIQNSPRSIINGSIQDRTDQRILHYPADLANHYILFAFKEFDYVTNENPGDNTLLKSAAHIVLPLPKELKQDYTVNYRDAQLGGGLGELLNIAEEMDTVKSHSLIEGGQSYANGSAQGEYGNWLEQAGAAGDAAAVAGRALLRGLISERVSDAIGVATGFALNPNDRAVLDNVPLREHTFSWVFSPKNAAEHTDLKNIIKLFRSKMYPSRQGLNGNNVKATYLFKYPQVLDIAVGNFEHPFFYKTSAITSFKVDMASEGSVVMLQGTEGPAVYNITLTVKELESIDAADFTSLEGDG